MAARVLAERHGTTEQTTVWKWRKRDGVKDHSHRPHRLQTTLIPAQEAVAVALRRMLLISLDDLVAVVQGFLNSNVSRGLDRCLRTASEWAICGNSKQTHPSPGTAASRSTNPDTSIWT